MTNSSPLQVSQTMGYNLSTVNTEGLTSPIHPLSLTKRGVNALTIPQHQDLTAHTQSEGTHSSSDPIHLDVSRYLPFAPFARQSRESFRTLQKWEGYVLEVLMGTFLARLTPIQGEGADQEAEIYLEEIDQADRVLVEPGAVFYWSIGYLDRPSGRIRASIIRFRRLPGWTKGDLQRAEVAAEQLKALFVDD